MPWRFASIGNSVEPLREALTTSKDDSIFTNPCTIVESSKQKQIIQSEWQTVKSMFLQTTRNARHNYYSEVCLLTATIHDNWPVLVFCHLAWRNALLGLKARKKEGHLGLFASYSTRTCFSNDTLRRHRFMSKQQFCEPAKLRGVGRGKKDGVNNYCTFQFLIRRLISIVGGRLCR
jgi:hypothetical protein